jgi:hypothetical protein
MKSLKFLSVIAGCFFLAQITDAQPAISKEYANEAIAGMIQKYKMSDSRDAIPPAELAAKRKADFPKAYNVEWETDGAIYEAEFNIRFRDYKAYYDLEGNLLMAIEEIYRSELPAIVRNVAEAKYPKYNFEDIDKIRRGTEIFYKTEMEFRDAEVKLLIKSDGTISEEKFDD